MPVERFWLDREAQYEIARRQTAAQQAEVFTRQSPHQISIHRATQKSLCDNQSQTGALRFLCRPKAVM